MGKKTEYNYLEDLFRREVEDAYHDEVQLAESFGRFRDSAGNPVLGELFERLRRQSLEQSTRLQEEIEPGKPSRRGAVTGLLEEGQHRVDQMKNHHLVDAELISIAQKILALGMAGLQTAEVYARLLRKTEIGALLSDIGAKKKMSFQNLSEVALHQVHWRADWWAPEHTSGWERVKTAFHKDWQQTKAHVGVAGAPPEEQRVGDTLAEMSGRSDSTSNSSSFEAQEPAFRYGYGAAHYYRDREWDPQLERELQSNYGGLWDPAQESIRGGWNYARKESRSIPLEV